MTEDTRAGRAMPPSRVHQLGRMDRTGLLGTYMQLVMLTTGEIGDAIRGWDRDQLINAIITQEELRAARSAQRKEQPCPSG